MLVDFSGLVVTNNHVIEGADVVKVSLSDKREFEAEIVLKDQRSDLAILRIKGQGERFPVIEFSDSDAVQVGDLVLAIGNPFGVGQTVTHGHRLGPGAHPGAASATISSSSRPTPPSIPATRAARWSTSPGKLVGINTAIYLAHAAARTASALPFPPTW